MLSVGPVVLQVEGVLLWINNRFARVMYRSVSLSSQSSRQRSTLRGPYIRFPLTHVRGLSLDSRPSVRSDSYCSTINMGVRSFFSRAAVAALAVTGCQGIRIIQSSDDGWAELYLRSFHDSLLAGGHDAVVSAPADNQSGRGKSLRAVNNSSDRQLPRLVSYC